MIHFMFSRINQHPRPREVWLLVLILSKGALCLLLVDNEMLLIPLYLTMRSHEQIIINMLFAFRKPCRCLNEENEWQMCECGSRIDELFVFTCQLHKMTHCLLLDF